ncbi:tripartite tricarboxylate transporter permease [Pelagibacterium lacus]|uniref:Tripartite tricarboxylate transporter permease n=1 Tax=Pelagibacterium lacus TaxID=2282655 RepID=A0A369W3F2_9HYPH|nr:tripartite tricarboxylate transporter permease [Pelagibacterium lacus]RDE07880.1 tripartite tricarboxylate transporter permease [Pelagibacterium lacus]
MDILTELSANASMGLAVALQPANILYCFIGVFLGTLLGVIPGIGTLAAMTLLFPFTFQLEPTSGLIMLAGIYYGTNYGGTIAAILLNVPGTPGASVTCLDGYPMAKQGRAGVALLMTAVPSFVGASFGIILLMVFAPVISENALRFGPAEYFSLMVLGLVAACTISSGSAAKGLAMVVLGIAFGLVGSDIYTGTQRFTFGVPVLTDGIELVALAMGLFGLPEVIASVRGAKDVKLTQKRVTLKSMIPTRDDIRRSLAPMLRASGIGSFFGTLPGTGGLIASFMSYSVEKRVSKDPSRFGKGAIEGVVAPETANNAADMTAFIPTLTLGIPGSTQMAIMLGIFIIHGITPGPQILTQHPELVWGLIMSFWLGNILLLVLNIPLIGLWVRMLSIPYSLLYPGIVVFICAGVYSISNSVADVIVMVFFGALGYLMRYLNFPAAPLILGFVLGPMIEEHFRRAMLYSRGDPATFIQSPISGVILAISAVLVIWTIVNAFRSHRQRRALNEGINQV